MNCRRASWYVDTIKQRKHVCVARNATKTIAGRSSSTLASNFRPVVGHTYPGDTNSGTAWRLLPRMRLSWQSPNGLGFAPVCWELWYRDLWMRHREPADVVPLPGWMGEQGAAAVVAAEEPFRGGVWMTATGSRSHWRDDCWPQTFSIGRASGTVSPGCSLWLLPSFRLILFANTDWADSVLYNSVRVCSLELIPMEGWQFTPVKRT